MARLLEKIRTKIVSHTDWWKDYMTEMSILVISLAATFYAENLIQSYQEAQDDNHIMAVVVNELEADINEMSEMLVYYQTHKRFAQVLNQKLVKHEFVAVDTMQLYNNYHRLLYYWTLKKNALDMMKESGTMQRMENRELLAQIIEAYEWIGIVKKMDSQFLDDKKVQIIDFVSHIKEGAPAEKVIEQWNQIEQHLAFKRYLIYASPLQSNAIINQLEECKGWIQRTIELIKQDYKITDIETR